MKSVSCIFAFIVAAAAVVVGACDDTTDPVSGPQKLRVVTYGGNNQVAQAGATLAAPLLVRVTDAAGKPMKGLAVRWRVSGGGIVNAPFSDTDTDGVASITITLPEWAAKVVTVATLQVPADTVVFESTSLLSGAFRIELAAGVNDTHTDTVLATLPAYRVIARDHLARPVAGVPILWSAIGGGTVSAAETRTNASGIAETTHTLSRRTGLDIVEAWSTGLDGSPVRFVATAKAGKPVALSKASGDDQVGRTNNPVDPYVVKAFDAYGNAVSGVPINWTVVSGGGTLSFSQTITNQNGAEVRHTLGPVEGVQEVMGTAAQIAGAASQNFRSTAYGAIVDVNNYSYYGTYDDVYFWPKSVTVATGHTVVWRWRCSECVGPTMHTVTFEDDPSPPASALPQANGSHKRIFTTPGTYRFRCTIHSTSFTEGMVGTIVVQ